MLHLKKSNALWQAITLSTMIWAGTASCYAATQGLSTNEAIKQTMPPAGTEVIPDKIVASKADISAIKARKHGVQLFEGIFMRDPFIFNAPDGYYYYSSTRLDRILGGDNNNFETEGVEIWRSKDLANWELVGVPYRLGELSWKQAMLEKAATVGRPPLMWAPEIHFINNKWVIVHTTSVQASNILVADKVTGPFREPMQGQSFGHRHDATLFQDDDKKIYVLYKASEVQEVKADFSGFVGEPFKIGPSDRPIGHEGLSMVKIGKKYVLFGTAWSTDQMRKGSYNLYYVVADDIRGPYSARKFLGRFLGHGTPFTDKEGKWWTMAFANGDYVSPDQISSLPTQNDKPYAIMKSGAMLVPLELAIDAQGIPEFTVSDERFNKPGPEEVTSFKGAK